MPRRRRYWERQACYHITHRCHERRFLLRYAKYRDMYRQYLFEMAQRFNVRILGWTITSNHIHLLITTGLRGSPCISQALQFLHGEVAQHYNLQRKREGSFWTNRFHATKIQNGNHLRRCLLYIDMNMIRAGVVSDPRDWSHGSCHEIHSGRQRYLTVARDTLLNRREMTDWDYFLNWYQMHHGVRYFIKIRFNLIFCSFFITGSDTL